MTSPIRKVGAAAIAATAGAAITMGGAQLASATSATATTGVNIRSGPGTSYSIIGGLTRGQSITIVGKAKNGWSKVRFNGDTAYVSAQYLDSKHGSVSTASVTIYTKGNKVTTAPLNVRSGPGLNNKVVGYLSSGQDVSLTGKQSRGFAEILYGGTRAWVSSQYLASSSTGLPQAAGSRYATADLLIRTSTDSDFKIITTVKKGTKLQITGSTRNGYAQIVYGNAIRWVTAKYLSNAAVSGPTRHAPSTSGPSSSTPSHSKAGSSKSATHQSRSSSSSKSSSTPRLPSVVGSRYATTELLVRTTSGSDYKTVATVKRGDQVKITGHTTNGRAQIVYGGSVRWVTAQYLSTSKPMSASRSTSASAASVKSNSKKADHETSHKSSTRKTSGSTSSGGLDPSYSGASRNVSNGVWDQLAMCESSGNWSINTGNGFYGGLQFTLQTWRGFGGTGMPQNASRSEQIKVAERILAVQGWKAWPACSSKLGLR